jgi:4-carboxymuconolactone decarboxylase
MAESELHKKGNEIRRQLLGDKYVERVNASTYQDPIMRTFIDVATENVFGALWARPGLDLKTRTLVCVVSDAATGREPELRIHLRMALNQGWTETELTEVLIHMSGYPRGHDLRPRRVRGGPGGALTPVHDGPRCHVGRAVSSDNRAERLPISASS